MVILAGKRERARLEEVAESIPEPLIVYDDMQRGTYGNRAAMRLFGRSFVERSVDEWGRMTDPRDDHGMELALNRTMNSTLTHDAHDQIVQIFDDQSDDGAMLTIPYTYSVYFRPEPKVTWSNRWDLYFVNQDDSNNIHWFAIVNSIVISGLLTAVVAVIFTRTIRGDIKGYMESGLEDGERLKTWRDVICRTLRCC